MNALRTLPILNRPSRPSSPAPPATQTTTATAQPHSALGITHTASEPGKPRSRSLSRQVVDKVSAMHPPPAPTNGHTHAHGHTVPAPAHPTLPLGKKGNSPPGSRPVTPRIVQTPLPGVPAEGGNAPQGGYMDVLGLRLNEAVNKACAGVDYKAKKGFKKGSGWNLGEAVVKELPFPPSDAYLIRAVLRTSVKSLSIYTTRLESLLLPALTDSLFASPLNLSAPTPSSHPLNPVQYFALSVAHAAWESCEVLEQTLETGNWPRFVSETLRPVMDKLDLVVGKVIQPLLGGLKRDLVAALSRTDGTSPTGGKVVGLAHTAAPVTPPVLPVTKESSNAPLGRLTKELSGSGHARQLPVPVALQHFAARVDGARKVLDLIAGPCADDGEGWVTGVVVAVIWKGMCVFSEKDIGPLGARPPSPGSVAKALTSLKLEKEGSAQAPNGSNGGGSMAPPPALGGMTGKLATMLPSRAASRPASPPRLSSRWDPMTHALMSLEGLIKRLVSGLVEPCPGATQTTDNPGPEHIAREALHEAIEALTSFRTVSAAMHGRTSPAARLLASSRRIRDDVDDDNEEKLDDAMEDMPAVTLIIILLRQVNLSLAFIPPSPSEKGPSANDLRIRHPAELWGWSTAEYERQVLGGFAGAEDWGKRVALAIKPEIERVVGLLGLVVQRYSDSEINYGEKGQRNTNAHASKDIVLEAMDWVRSLGVCCEARGGVRIPAAV